MKDRVIPTLHGYVLGTTWMYINRILTDIKCTFLFLTVLLFFSVFVERVCVNLILFYLYMTEFEKKNLNPPDDSFTFDLNLHHVSRTVENFLI